MPTREYDGVMAFVNKQQYTIFLEVILERQRQDEKWGYPPNNELPVWVTILGEEFGEVCRAILEYRAGTGDRQAIRRELIEVAAVAISAVEQMDIKFVAES